MTISNTDKDLSSLVDRLVRCEETRIAAVEDIAELKKEAKSSGYDVRAISKLAKFRLDEQALTKFRKEQQTLEIYASDIGLDLFRAADAREQKDE
jgi:uncharacterized protein (UPF0335 family)